MMVMERNELRTTVLDRNGKSVSGLTLWACGKEEIWMQCPVPSRTAECSPQWRAAAWSTCNHQAMKMLPYHQNNMFKVDILDLTAQTSMLTHIPQVMLKIQSSDITWRLKCHLETSEMCADRNTYTYTNAPTPTKEITRHTRSLDIKQY